MQVVFLKAHVKSYFKNDGTVVLAHDTKVQAKGKPKQLGLFVSKPKTAVAGPQFGGKMVGAPERKPWRPPAWPHAIKHPRPHDDGGPFQINQPSTASGPETWSDPAALATFVPDGAVPPELNGVPLAPWDGAPTTVEGWAAVEGQAPEIEEPELLSATMAGGLPKEQAAGVIIEESDGRVWLMRPSNGFGGYDATFPKGRADDGLSLQASAIKEAYEETGLQVQITGYWGDIERTQTVARYYTAKRVGGTPAAMGWEAQAVQLCPRNTLEKVLNSTVDHKILAMGNK